MFIQYHNNTIEILSNDLYYYDDWDDDTYDLDRHTPIASALVEGQDYSISGNTVNIHATFEIPVTMVSGHALDLESELDLAADTADYYLYPSRGVDITVDFWNTGFTQIELAPEYQADYNIERASGVPAPAGVHTADCRYPGHAQPALIVEIHLVIKEMIPGRLVSQAVRFFFLR